jgi:hypothetical protein
MVRKKQNLSILKKKERLLKLKLVFKGSKMILQMLG